MSKSNQAPSVATKKAVLKSATHLMAIYGFTTTLEVKLYLRAIGYIAFQRDMSRWMEELALLNGWGFESNGTFRTYYPTQRESGVGNIVPEMPAFSMN